MTPVENSISKFKNYCLSNDLERVERLNLLEYLKLLTSIPRSHAVSEGILRSTQNKNRHVVGRGRSEEFGLQPGPLKRPRQDSFFSRDLGMIPEESPSSTHDPLPVPRVKKSSPVFSPEVAFCRFPLSTIETRSFMRCMALAAAM